MSGMNLPSRYLEARKRLSFDQVSLGYGGIKVFPLREIEEAQVGYSVSPDGAPLCGSEPGDWNANWIVIGYETGLGDPLFIDAGNPDLPVFTAMHGESSWNPDLIGKTPEAFAASFDEFREIAAKRQDPISLEENPITDGERKAFLQRIAELNGIEFAPEFWSVLVQDF